MIQIIETGEVLFEPKEYEAALNLVGRDKKPTKVPKIIKLYGVKMVTNGTS